MKRFVAVVAGLALLAAPASAALRLFFSTQGAFSNQVVNDVSAAPAGPGAVSNPVAPNHSILYLWAQMLPGPTSQKWNGIAFDIQVNGGIVEDRRFYNYTVVDPDFGDILFRRWQGVNEGAGVGTPLLVGANLAGVNAGEGVSNSLNASLYDDQSEIGPSNAGTASARRNITNGKSVLLGWIQVAATSPEAQVFLRVGTGGITREGAPTPQPIYFGAGDEGAGLTGASFLQSSPLADATVVPEPASLALLALAAFALRRR